jgi:hypothetical protein
LAEKLDWKGLNRKNVTQNGKKYKWKINIKLTLKNSFTAKGAHKQITELSR